MPNVAICFLTYKRTHYAVPALISVLENLHSAYPIFLHIADNNSPPEHVETLLNIARKYPLQGVSVSVAKGGGYGNNYNVATQSVHAYADYIIPLEDDWKLVQPLDVDTFVFDLQERSGCIRLGNIGLVGRIYAELININERLYWRLDPKSPDQYIFSGNPRIETVGWERMVGPWPTGLTAGETEIAVGTRMSARTNVLWPFGLKPSEYFVHMGTEKT